MSQSNNSINASSGIGIPTVLTIIFVVLRLIPAGNPGQHVINWSWWWVLSPIWISWLLALAILLLVLVVIAVVVIAKGVKK